MRKISNSELNRISVEEFKKHEKIPVVVILDDIRSLNNIGSVFRTSDAFLIEKIHLCGITAKPPHREIQKTALGATESVDWEYHTNINDCVNTVKSQGFKVFAVEQLEGSTTLEEFRVEKDDKIAVILGNEVAGVSEKVIEFVDGGIEIPQYGTKHSLNISVCTGIVLWHLFKQFKL